MLHDRRIFDALDTAIRVNPKSKVFKTPCHALFLEVCKIAHDQKENGEPVLWLENPDTGQSRMFPFTAFVYKMNAGEVRAMSREFNDIWKSATHPKEFSQNIQLDDVLDIVPLQIEGLNEFQLNFIGRRLAAIDSDLKKITGNNQPTTVDLYPNFELVGNGHAPTHPQAVMNETWLQAGTVITNEDGEEPEQIAQGSRLFMPPQTYHRPPLPGTQEVNPLMPRLSLISNACTYG